MRKIIQLSKHIKLYLYSKAAPLAPLAALAALAAHHMNPHVAAPPESPLVVTSFLDITKGIDVIGHVLSPDWSSRLTPAHRPRAFRSGES